MHDDERHEMVDYASAIFTMKYSETGMKLFIGGGPRKASVPVHYACLDLGSAKTDLYGLK